MFRTRSRLNEAFVSIVLKKADFVHIKKLMSKIELKSTPLPPALALFGQAGWAGEPQIAKLWLLLANCYPTIRLLY